MIVSELWFTGAELLSFVVSSETRECVTNPPNSILRGALPCAGITGFVIGCSFRLCRVLILIPVSPWTTVSKFLICSYPSTTAGVWPIDSSTTAGVWPIHSSTTVGVGPVLKKDE